MELGTKARDIVTGFEGVVTAHAQHITGCDTLFLNPPAKDGEVKDGAWFDIDRCVATDEPLVRVPQNSGKPGGAPLPAPR